jgi:hypothetical protein
VSPYENHRRLDTVEQKRQRYSSSRAPEVGGAAAASPVAYASGQVRMVKLNSVPRGPQGIVLPRADVKGLRAASGRPTRGSPACRW